MASAFPIDLIQFQSLGVFTSTAKQSHTVDKGNIPGSEDTWYRKELESPAKARSEWLAQEFLRLIIPNQVETRLAFNSLVNVFYILSKEIPGFRLLPEGTPEKFLDGTYQGLGYIIMAAYFIHEADLKNGNIGLDLNNFVTKIDGDWAFASMRNNQQFPPHSATMNLFQLKNLPFPITYRAYNWMDLIVEGEQFARSGIINQSIKFNKRFNEEKFETMLKLLLIPESYFSTFVDAFIPAGAESYSNYLLRRRQGLFKEALKLTDFVTYLKENPDKIRQIADTFLVNMADFVVNGEFEVIPESSRLAFIEEAKKHMAQTYTLLGLNSPAFSNTDSNEANNVESNKAQSFFGLSPTFFNKKTDKELTDEKLETDLRSPINRFPKTGC